MAILDYPYSNHGLLHFTHTFRSQSSAGTSRTSGSDILYCTRHDTALGSNLPEQTRRPRYLMTRPTLALSHILDYSQNDHV